MSIINFPIETLEERADAFFDDGVPARMPPLDCWIKCEDPRCFQHGCMKATPKPHKGGHRHV